MSNQTRRQTIRKALIDTQADGGQCTICDRAWPSDGQESHYGGCRLDAIVARAASAVPDPPECVNCGPCRYRCEHCDDLLDYVPPTSEPTR